jgi:hypothetical protein
LDSYPAWIRYEDRLEETRGDKWDRGKSMQFTWPGRSAYVQVKEVRVTTTAGKSKRFHLELEIGEQRREAFLDVSLGNRTPDHLTEIGLRSALFGEPNPLLDQNWDSVLRQKWTIRSCHCGIIRYQMKLLDPSQSYC